MRDGSVNEGFEEYSDSMRCPSKEDLCRVADCFVFSCLLLNGREVLSARTTESPWESGGG